MESDQEFDLGIDPVSDSNVSFSDYSSKSMSLSSMSYMTTRREGGRPDSLFKGDGGGRGGGHREKGGGM